MQNRIIDELAAARKRDRDTGAREMVEDVVRSANKQIELTRQRAEQFVTAHPEICLAAAVGLGLAFGWWIKRR